MPEEDKAEERMNIFSQISLKFDVITFHMPQGVLRNFRSCRGVPLNHLPMVYCLSINVLTRCSHVAILKKNIYHLRVKALLSLKQIMASHLLYTLLAFNLSFSSPFYLFLRIPLPLCVQAWEFSVLIAQILSSSAGIYKPRGWKDEWYGKYGKEHYWGN